ncbi:hypothetical protein CCR83_09730 [Rhodobacter veldkampii DSM 11550]|uniref:Uncharacterized protein n=1 Tax=Phaeovulum veldkampii DSM 11550 TaxID=1185920 RepID=A0A2T4JBB9_9RHOB|nr:hypothetical protein [Phaeovulum veldkampii]MBK5946705.1 hypothetical protein [Phaeovulum veldkampii DSM 11550]PTE15194.1 hypothetical protein C5F46_14065 [Phaeovulum veldkampii DSM 11550]TDQ59246.1 hypothetical protein EV658_10811 [Phaeovulum veldkampii DSM 11550]
MSDSKANVQIEDVLSSIRRLVSQGQTVPDGSAPVSALTPPRAADSDMSEADRLVLTPALRVAGFDSHEVDVWPDLAQDDQFDVDLTGTGAHVQQDVTGEEAARQPVAGAQSPGVDAPLPAVIEADPAVDLGAELTRLESTIAAMEAAVAVVGDAFHAAPDAADTAPVPPAPASVLPEQAAAAPQAAAMAPPAGAEPRRLHLRDPFESMPDDMAESEDLLALSDDEIFDEEALRALIADVVRQELQGMLGERITRNVRKLVRREIQRALASRDFE